MENIDFLCINCQEVIRQEDVYMHSVVCVYPSEIVMKKESASQHELTLFKLGKMKNSLVKVGGRGVEEEILGFLVSKIEEVERVQVDLGGYESCQSILYILERYSEAKLSSYLLIYIERFKVLIGECMSVIEQEVDEVKVNRLDVKYKEIQKAKLDVLSSKTPANHNIDEISSQISRIWNFGPESLSNPESDLLDQNPDDLDFMFKQSETEQGKKNEEDLMKYFYSKCLSIKMAIPLKGAQNVQVMELYKKAVSLRVPVEKWEDFIKDQLLSAQNRTNQ